MVITHLPKLVLTADGAGMVTMHNTLERFFQLVHLLSRLIPGRYQHGACCSLPMTTSGIELEVLGTAS